jgi:hypothetical protein
VPHVPQFRVSVIVLVQTPPQVDVPAGHPHAPFVHD